MNVNHPVLLAITGLLMAGAGVSALDIDVDVADIRRAGEIAISSEAARARFHEAYNVPIDDPTVERIEIISEFRRIVMEAERQNALGNWMMARGGYDSKGRTLQDMLKEFRGQLAIRVQIRFHPLHTYSTVPKLEIALGEPSLLTVASMLTPIASSPDAGLTGAIVETAFNAPSIGDAILPVQILLEKKEIARVLVDFSRVR